MLLPKCAVCNSKKSKFIKEQEARGIWYSLTKTPNTFIRWGNLTRPSIYDIKEEIKVEAICGTMLSYRLKCRKNTRSKKPKVLRTKTGRIMLVSKCAACNSKTSKFIKEQKAKGLLGNLLGAKITIFRLYSFFKKSIK